MIGFARRRTFFDVLLAEARCLIPIRSYCRRTPGINDVVATLVAQAFLSEESTRRRNGGK